MRKYSKQLNKEWLDSPFSKHIYESVGQNSRQDPSAFEEKDIGQLFMMKTQKKKIETPALHMTPWSENIQMSMRPLFDGFNYTRGEAQKQLEQVSKKIEWSEMQEEENMIEQSLSVTPKRLQIKLQSNLLEHKNLSTTGSKSCKSTCLRTRKPRPTEKGLRCLSERAYQIVIQLKSATYKDVANQLVAELKIQKELQNHKQQQNVKRRVYDALNVLIALGVLKKNGRQISGERRLRASQNQQMSRQQEFDLLKQKLQVRKFRIEEKNIEMSSINQKYQLIKLFIKRNIKSNQRRKIIQFPFIGAICQNLRQENITLDNDKFELRCAYHLEPFGDVDMITLLKEFFPKHSNI